MLQKHCLYLSILIIMDYSLFPSWQYMLFEYGVYGIRILFDMAFILWHCIMLHFAFHWHLELCREPMVPTVPVQRCLLGITMQLRTLLGMKARVHIHPYTYIIVLA